MFSDRIAAAHQLVARLEKYKGLPDGLVLAVPRGGVPIAYIVARDLNLPLSLVLTKKIGHPANKEYAIGAASLTDSYIFRPGGISSAYINGAIARIRRRLKEMYSLYLGDRPTEAIEGKTVIVIDDGIATGNTLLATISMLRKENPAKIVVATPVSSKSAYTAISKEADELVALYVPEAFWGVGDFYKDFSEVTDKQVIYYLTKLWDEHKNIA